MTLADEAILLRPWAGDDLRALVEACGDPDISRWTAVPSPYTREDGRAFLASRGEGDFAIVDRPTGELAGAIALHLGNRRPSLGYWVKREARGREVATRAVTLVARWGIRIHGLPRISLMTEPGNTASQRVAEKAGFRREGLLRSYLELKGSWRDCVMFSLVPADLAPPGEAGELT